MKKTLFVALVALMTTITALAADNDAVNMTITLKNGLVITYKAADMDSVRYVGGKFRDDGAIGMKIYLNGSTQSIDYLYSQIDDVTYTVVTTTTFTRVTNINQLETGKRYIIVCESMNGAMGGAYNNTFRALVTSGITLANGTATVEDNSNVVAFELGGTTGNYTLKVGNDYLSNPTSTTHLTTVSTLGNNEKWAIAFENNNAKIKNNSTSRFIYYYNAGGYFDAFTTGTPVQLYVEGTITPADNNANANWHESLYANSTDHDNFTTSRATYGMAWGLEYPHISTDANSIVVVHASTASSQYNYQGGISYSLELNKSLRANRWSCFTMHNGTPNNDVGRSTSSFNTDDCIETSYQVDTKEYTNGNYTANCTNLDGSNMTLFARGHICASEDRQSSTEQNKHTFLTSNIHPQYQAHNAGIWKKLESKVQDWGYSSSFRDTLYVCKGATITDNITLNGTTTTGIITNSEVYNQFGVNITGTITIPRYWYMAVLCLKNGQYHAMAFWSEQINSSCSSTTLQSCMISIDELERRTGIDFFCNLPDDIENTVEATVETSFWNLSQ